MLYRSLGSSGLIISDLALGTMNFGQNIWGTDEQKSIKILENYIDMGGNFIDTADVYSNGESERIVGKAIKGKRDKIVLATKCSCPLVRDLNKYGSSRYNIIERVEDSLKRLDVDHIDLLYIHLWDPITPFIETLSTLNDLVHAGKIRYAGVSNWTGWQISELSNIYKYNNFFEPIIVVQNQYSLAFRGIEYEVISVCEYNKIGLVCYSPLAGGVLAGVYADGSGPNNERYSSGDPYGEKFKKFYINQRNLDLYFQVKEVADKVGVKTSTLSIAWLLNKRAVSSVLMGPRDSEQMKDYISASELIINNEIMSELDKISSTELPYPYSQQARYIPDFFGEIENIKKSRF